MTKKSMGQFIAALRKANGMTQQAVADRLNVSNKAVSRWERDESAPDISLIPALAELLGVTCDELLKGERIINEVQAEKTEPKVEKQLNFLLNRTISNFKNLIWISFALTIVGFICMFGISYGFYRPVIGFAVMLVFEVAALIVTVIAVNKMKETKNDNELFENADKATTEKYNNCLGSYSFNSLFAIFSAVVLSLPLLLVGYIAHLPILSYFLIFFIVIGLLLVVIYLNVKKTFVAWVMGEPITEKIVVKKEKPVMSIIQLSLTAVAGILLFMSTLWELSLSLLSDILTIAGTALLVGNIVCFVVYLIKGKGKRKNILVTGLRNIFMIPSACLLTGVYQQFAGKYGYREYWTPEFLYLSLALGVVVFAIFAIIQAVISRKKK